MHEASSFRADVASGAFTGHWSQVPAAFAQANLLVLPREHAYDFLVFAQRNKRECGLIEVLDPGDPQPRASAPGADVRTDCHRYRVWRDGRLVDTVTDIIPLWRPDLVTFLLGCSFTFATALRRAGIEFQTGGVYRTSLGCIPSGPFRATAAVSMRSMSPADAVRAAQITARFPDAHGAPLHVGDPAAIGIRDLGRPEYTIPGWQPVPAGHIPVFWGCSVTAEIAAARAAPDLMITLLPPYMLITDLLVDELTVR